MSDNNPSSQQILSQKNFLKSLKIIPNKNKAITKKVSEIAKSREAKLSASLPKGRSHNVGSLRSKDERQTILLLSKCDLKKNFLKSLKIIPNKNKAVTKTLTKENRIQPR
ncbi:hypothetical protein JWG44_02495 [Leptospira sp. 201903071]|uniref:hypothetical protein n=1 Tax=Leptospira ainazelensis TaxID=2810034 RepID=UPI0019630573|nr:hypothetical protein [Leptospira ainazelensis]MBM9499123.1 hypothetical protein [Leptospira ainazelensis]